MSSFEGSGHSVLGCTFRGLRVLPAIILGAVFAAFSPGIAAQSSQLQNLNAGCGADYLGQTWNCTAGEIAISQVLNVQIDGNPSFCVRGEPLLVNEATVQYSINTQTRNDLTMYIGDQEGTDPRGFAGAGRSCSAFSVPGPFNPTPDSNNPWGNADGDQCGDLAFSVTAGSRTFTDVPITCQDNDGDGTADLQFLLTWDQNAAAACGTGAGQTFPTDGGTRSKCDNSLRSLNIPVIDPGTLTIIKNVNGGNDDFNFFYGESGQTPNVLTLSTANGTAQTSVQIIDGLGGTFVVGEGLTDAQIAAGWKIESAQCVYDDAPGIPIGTPDTQPDLRAIDDITIEPGDAVTCTFVNNAPASVTVTKISAGGEGAFVFSSNLPSPLDSFVLDTTGTGGSTSTGPVAVAVPDSSTGLAVTITESFNQLPPGWNLADITCSGTEETVNNNVVDFTLQPGDNVTCTFTNTKQGTLTIIKETLGGDRVFQFRSTSLPDGDFTIQTTNNTGSQNYDNLPPNVVGYTVDEEVPPGWDLTDRRCVETGGISNSGPLGPTGIGIILEPGETVVCTFTNTQRGAIVIRKETDPAGTDTFGFTSTSGTTTPIPASFSVDAGSSITFNNGGDLLLPGTYTVTEDDPTPDFDLTGLVCIESIVVGPNVSTVDVDSRTATINLDPGELVTCTYTNSQRADLTIVKSVTEDGPANSNFLFTSTQLGNLALGPVIAGVPAPQPYNNLVPGVYDFAEDEADALSKGWALVNAFCSDGSTVDNIVLDPGDDVTCTFTNAPIGSATIVKNTVGGDDTFEYVGTAPFDGLQLTTVAGSASQDYGFQLDPANNPYGIQEDPLPPGWSLTDLGCVEDGDQDSTTDFQNRSATINAQLGEQITCTFTNTADGTISIRKETLPDGVDLTFGYTGDLAGSIRDFSTFGEEIVSSLQPGTYSSTETVPAGWQITGISCDDSQAPGSTFTFTNSITQGGTDAFEPGDDTVNVTLAAGENVICSFENTQESSISIVKNTVGGDGTFSFSSIALGGFSITTSGNTGQQAFPELLPGQFLVAETPVPAGWALTDIACTGATSSTILIGADDVFTDGDTGVTIDLAPGEDIVCSFQNTVLAASIDLVKTGTLNDDDGTTGVSAGDTISYVFTVTNTGATTLSNVTLADTVGGVTISGGPIASLAPGAVDSTTFTGSYTLTQGDVDAGTFTNTATVTGTPPLGDPVTDPDSDTQTLAQSAAITLTKTGTLNDDDGTAGVSAGDTISYAFTVTNTGNVTLSNVTLADTVGGVTISGGPIASLAPGAVDNTTFTGSYTLTQGDVDAGTFTNTATVTGTPPSGPNVTAPDSDTQTLAATPAVEIVKTGTLDDGGDGPTVGDVIGYSFDVTNTGNVTLTNVSVTDPLIASISCPGGNPIPSLAPGASVQCTGSYAITQVDIDAGNVLNTATVSGDCPQSQACATDTDTHTEPLAPTPAVEIAKTGTLDDGGDGATVGDVISYIFTVTNTGGVTLTNVSVTDPLIASISCPGGNPIPSLAPGASVQCTGSYAITQADVDAGSRINTATVTGDCPDAPACATDTDTNTVTLTPPPPPRPVAPIPVNNPWALLLLTLIMLAAGWHYRPAKRRRF